MLVDMTLPVSGSLPAFPGSPPPQLIPWSGLEEDGYNLELAFMSTHTGTHIDAPYHFAAGGIRVDEIPLERLAGSGLLARIRAPRGGLITESDIESFEGDRGRLEDGASLFIHTGWQKRLHKHDYFTQNPGLSPGAAGLLASRGVSLVGTDSPSIDPGTDTSFRAHRILAEAGILIVENLANLGRLGPEFDFVILPLRLEGASGSPVRAVAAKR